MDVENQIQEINKIKYAKNNLSLKKYQKKESNVHLPLEVRQPSTKQSSNTTILAKTFHSFISL